MHNHTPSKLWRFHGGLKLPGHKASSMRASIAPATLPRYLILPVQQHIGAPAVPIVKIGERVLKNQCIAKAEGLVSVPVHASSSGTVIAIEPRPVAHPSGMPGLSIVIETDGKDEALVIPGASSAFAQQDPAQIRERIRDAGIVGLGGAGFPAFIKLNPGPGYQINTLILNGAECEPYITCDAMLMQEQPREILDGLLIMQHALQAQRCLIGIEDNKPEAIAALRNALTVAENQFIKVVAVPTIYPAGGEKQLIRTLTGIEVPAQQLPASMGVICHNVATAFAIAQAISRQQPLITRVVTVTGSALTQARNYWVRLGTPMRDLLEQAGATNTRFAHLTLGGPMMGLGVTDTAAPVIKTSNCLLAQTENKFQTKPVALPCIRCGECARVCPAQLLPQQLYWHAHAKDFDKIQDFHLFDCIECGCCDYVCPSHIPLVQYYRFAKTEIWAKEREAQKSDIARQRHEFHLWRIERKKLDDEERKRKKMELLNKVDADEDHKQSAIEAALQRVHAKKAAQQVQPRNTDNLSDTQRKLIHDIDQRRMQHTEPAPNLNKDKNP